MNHEEELSEAKYDYIEAIDEDHRVDLSDIEDAFDEGVKAERRLVLKMVDEYVQKLVKDIPTPSYDYEEGLRVAYKSIQEYLHIKLG